jgi:dTMP kinase
MSGKLILLEGLDGSGKTTQTGLLEKELIRRGIRLRRVKFPEYEEPSSAPVRMYLNGEFGKNPDDVNAYAASSFFAVDRYASFRRRWGRDYENGILILADRYTTSNIIYQMPKLPRTEWDGFLSWIQDFEYGKLGIPEPDLTVYLDMPPLISQKLLNIRYRENGGRRDIHESNTDYLNGCRESAFYAATKLGWQIVSCAENGLPKSRESIQKEILQLVWKKLYHGA